MDSSTEQKPSCRTEYRDIIDLLMRIPLFSVMPPEAIRVLACLSAEESFLAGDKIFIQDEIDEHAYYIMEGETELLLSTRKGEEKLKSYFPGDFIGGFSLLSSVKRLFTLRAKTDVRCLVVSTECFQKILDQFPEIAWDILREMTASVHRWEERLLHGHGRLCPECKRGVGVTLL
jgi:CRP/FNR family transcriptional regulator, cyclic AMP receptor protein